MRPFRQAGRRFWDLKLRTVDGRWVRRPVGTSDEVTANDIADMIDALTKTQAWDILSCLTAETPTLTLPQLWAWWQATPGVRRAGKMLNPGDDERTEYVREQLSVIDLDVLVTQWADAGAKPVYVEQVRKLVPEGTRFPLTQFRRSVIAAHLNKLPVTLNTKIHHRVAFSRFGQFLIGAELIETNPARDIEFQEKFRYELPVFLEPEQAKAVILAMPGGAFQAVNALAFCSGMEWSCIDSLHAVARRKGISLTAARAERHRLRARDFDWDRGTPIVFANGGKTKWRRRWIELPESDEWAVEIVRRYARTLAPSGIFCPYSWRAVDHRLEQACRAVGAPVVSFHKWRHTFTAMWVDRGALTTIRPDRRDERWMKNQVGHGPKSNLIRDTYGVRLHKVALTAQQEARLALAHTHDDRKANMK